MHKNHRRKNPRPCLRSRWGDLKDRKKHVLHRRVEKRRQKDRILLRKTLFDEDAWEEIRTFEEPVDWWEID